jgi:DHA2 family multidrug resistance protein-like MFS transporter
MLPGSLGVIAGSMLAPTIVRKVHPAYVMGGGLGLATVGFGVLTQVAQLGLAGLVAGTALVYLGLGPVFTLGTDLIVGAAPPERAGAAAAISETSSELGGALGIAILGSIGTAVYRGAMAGASLDAIPRAASRAAQETLGGAAAAAEQLPPDLGAHLIGVAREAFTRSLELTATICAVVAAITAVAAVVLLRRIGNGAHAQPARPDTDATLPAGVAVAGGE